MARALCQYAGRFMSFVLVVPMVPVVEGTVDFLQPTAQSASVSPTRTYQGLGMSRSAPTRSDKNC